MRKFFVSDFTQILCVEPLDHNDFKFLISSKKGEKSNFQNFYLMLEDPQKFLKSNFSNFLIKNVKSSFTGSWQIPKGTKS